jgi:uncharacterized protein involved in response to NO
MSGMNPTPPAGAPRPATGNPMVTPVPGGAAPASGRPTQTPAVHDPYRLLFPLGIAYAIAGTLLWTLHAAGLIAYPGALHRAFMIEGFELSFVLGFLLTAMAAFTHGQRCTRGELAAAFCAQALFGTLALAGAPTAAHAVALLALLLLARALVTRVRRAPAPPPEEFLFVAFGLLCGLAGVTLLMLESAGLALGPPRLGIRLLSLGMVLSLVLGLGGLLVPTFSGMRDPLVIPGLARAHERPPRRVLYLTLIALFTAAFALEALDQAGAGAGLRALAATVIGLLVWKLYRLPGRQDLPAFVLWSAGWMVLAGLWLTVLAPAHALAGEHVVFVGGFGLITFGIATRVVVSHGRHPITIEPGVLNQPVVLALVLALLVRVIAEWSPANLIAALWGVSGLLWAVAWGLWAARALPRIVRVVEVTAPPGGLVQVKAPAPVSRNS